MKHFFLITFLTFACFGLVSVSAEIGSLDGYGVDRVTEDVHVIHGSNTDPSPENHGFINNPGFIIADSGVVVIDPGNSAAIGRMLMKKIKQKTELPVIAIFNTHVHGDHWLANHAILQNYPDIPIYAHPEMIKKLEEGDSGKSWISLMQRLTDNAITGTELTVPTHPVKHNDEIKLGNKTFRIHHHGTSHTNNDIMVEVVESETVFLGDNVFVGRLPRLDDADVLNNISVIKKILQTNSKHYVPGHGPSGGESVPRSYLEYLTTLHKQVKHYYEEDLSDFEMKDQVSSAMEKFSKWYGFESELGKNISLVYLQIENADFQ